MDHFERQSGQNPKMPSNGSFEISFITSSTPTVIPHNSLYDVKLSDPLKSSMSNITRQIVISANNDYLEKTSYTRDIAIKMIKNAKYFDISWHIYKKGLDIPIYL